MRQPVLRAQRKDAGFTLIEALVAVVLMGLIMGALATVTAQWLPNWNRSLQRVQRNEQVAIALDRLVGDLSAAEYVSVDRDRKPLFEGNELSVTFVRTAIGPNSNPGLEIVRFAEAPDSGGPMLVRLHAPFVPLAGASVSRVAFSDPVVLLRPPFRTRFVYVGLDGQWVSRWSISSQLPAAVQFVVRDNAGRTVTTAARIRVNQMAPAPEQVDEQPAEGAQAGDGQAQTEQGGMR